MKMIRLSVNGTVDTVDINPDTCMHDVYAAIGNDCEVVQTLTLVRLPFPTILLVDDEGALKRSEVNNVATILYGHRLVGNILIASMQDGDLGGLTEKQLDDAMGYFCSMVRGVDETS